MRAPGQYDFIVVGAGTAGSVLANRLSADGKNRVLLLEAGPPDRYFWIHVPLGYGKTMFNRSVNWCSWSAPVERLNNRKLYCPRGKCLGGSSSINGMLYVRGQMQDYEGWSELGARGWDWAGVLPYFLKLEDHCRGSSPFHATSGPIHVSEIAPKHPLADAFIGAAERCGIPRNDDFNASRQEGAGYYDVAIKHGKRVSAADAYLKPARGRGNLTIETNTTVSRVDIVEGIADGVSYFKEGELRSARATKEVIVSAGAIGSPQLLQLSGIGPKALLESRGIKVAADVPGVGENLQDHFKVRLMFRCNRAITTNDDLNSWYRRIKVGLAYLAKRTGPLAIGINQAGAFVRAGEGVDRPNVQITFGTLSADFQGGKVHPFPGFTLMVLVLRPESRGHVRIKSADVRAEPEIQPNYLASEKDLATLIAGARLARRLVNTSPMKEYVAEEYLPGSACTSDSDWSAFVRGYATGLMHPCGTCRMGQDDGAVVDERLRVRRVKKLRVADASVMPAVVSGNTNTPTTMIAERASDLILQDQA